MYKALIDVVEWNPQSNDIFAYRFPETNLSTATQLIVRESQEAVFFSKGKIIGKFGPGKHTLSTENLPLLRNLYGIPFGGKNPFTAEVWFVNKTAPLTIEWKTNTMRYKDPEYGQMVPLTATGRYGLKVKDAESFLVQLVGTLSTFTSQELTNHFTGMLVSKTNSCIINYMTVNGISINSIAGHLDDLSQYIGQPMTEFWESYGFTLTGFYITEVNLDMSTEEGRKISEALSDRTVQAIAGYTWQQKQAFNVANNASSNGSSAGIFGVAMMTGAFSQNGGAGLLQTPNAGTYQMPMNGQNQFAQVNAAGTMSNAVKEVFCHNCGKKFSSDSAFCPYCGSKYNPCPACGADNAETASRCVKCGVMLKQQNAAENRICARCKNPIPSGVKFCPKCGNKVEL